MSILIVCQIKIIIFFIDYSKVDIVSMSTEELAELLRKQKIKEAAIKALIEADIDGETFMDSNQRDFEDLEISKGMAKKMLKIQKKFGSKQVGY